MLLPTELIDKIVLYTNDLNVANALENYITQYVFDKMEKNILIHGDVQSGKTNEIIKVLKKQRYINIPKVLVIQNSILVLKQYIKKLQQNQIDFQIITKETKTINKNVIVLLNNSYRYNYFNKFNINKYILILDESDQCIISCKLKSYKTIHVTATPFNYPKKLRVDFDEIIRIKNQDNNNKKYYGIEDLIIEHNDSLPIDDFLSTKNGMMLINRYNYIDEMKDCSLSLSKKYPDVPIILLTYEKFLYLNNKITKIKEKSIDKIIDSLNNHSHIIFIANRLSFRGLSYVSSNYKRHLTHQITKVRTNPANFLQSLRILGIYDKNTQLKLIIPTSNVELFKSHVNFYKSKTIEL